MSTLTAATQSLALLKHTHTGTHRDINTHTETSNVNRTKNSQTRPRTGYSNLGSMSKFGSQLLELDELRRVKSITLIQFVRTTTGALHQRGSNLIQVQSQLCSWFSHNLCCTTAVQIKIRLELRLSLNRRISWDQILISVQVAFTH